MSPVLQEDLAAAYAALRKARARMEDNACAEVPNDAATLRDVMSLVLDASCAVAGALAVARIDRDPPNLRVVR